MNNADEVKNAVFKAMEEARNDLLEKGENIIPFGAFTNFRKLILDSFGHRGLIQKLERVFEDQKNAPLRNGKPNGAWSGGNLDANGVLTMSD